MDKTKKGLLSSTASSHNKRLVPSSASAATSGPSMPSSSSASSQSILTSMRRHLPKATHGHLDTLSEWSRFRTAKKFEREQQHQQHLYGRMGASSVGAGGPNSSNVFKVQVPAKLMLVALAVFLVVPVSIFGWKETHWKVQKENEDLHVRHIRGGIGAKDSSYDPQWMEHNLYKKDEQQQPPPPASPTAEEGGTAAAGVAPSDGAGGEPSSAADATLDASTEGGTSSGRSIDLAVTNSTGIAEVPTTTSGDNSAAEGAGRDPATGKVPSGAGVSDARTADAAAGVETERGDGEDEGHGEEPETGRAGGGEPPDPT